jgi:phosphoribosylformimino-5-aminoimidazole carboxamide ribotide isomerase
MSDFIIYPAIDLQEGRVVRLKQGNRLKSKAFDLKPAGSATRWIEQGAEWLHVINLDGAFGEDSQENIQAVRKIIAAGKDNISIQLGGGMRSMKSIRSSLSLGVKRVILGTAAVNNPGLMIDALKTFGADKIVLAIDARDGFVHVAGWEDKTKLSPIELASHFIDHGLKTVIFTNIKHDGMQKGVDIKTTQDLADATGLQVIASGGVGSLEDIRRVKMAGLAGVVIGKALYENNFTFSEAVRC